MSNSDNGHREHKNLGLEGLRGVLAFIVAIAHFQMSRSTAPAFEIIAAVTVEVFFVLSGYVLAPQLLQIADGTISLWRFLVRRWMRTIPAYAVVVVAASIVAWPVMPADIGRYLVYSQNLFSQHNETDYFSVAWSLSVEEWFYIVFPATLILLRARGALFACLVFCGAVLALRSVAANAPDWGEEVRRVVIYRIDSIAIGFLFFLFQRERDLPSRAALALLLVAAPAGAVVLSYAGEGSQFARHVFPYFAAILGISCIRVFAGLNGAIVSAPILVTSCAYLGRISYSIYLVHSLAIPLMIGLPSAIISLCLYIIIIISLSMALYLGIEKPFIDARPPLRSI
jgi:peptidoglycan/LPS O-acetylase OafA/YrhL